MGPFRYTMYVDESGNEHTSPQALTTNKYLGVSGVIVENDRYDRSFVPAINNIKLRHFPSAAAPRDVDLHREDIMQARGHFSVLADPVKREAFDSDMLEFVRREKFRLITVAINKANHVAAYGASAKDAYHYCVEALLERYCLYLKHQRGIGDVVAEKRDTRKDRLLREVWNDFYFGGTAHADSRLIQSRLTSCEIKLRTKEHRVEGLQVSDLVVNPSKWDVLTTFGEPFSPPPFTVKMWSALEDRYDYRWTDGEQRGYGKVYLEPNRS